MNKKLISIILVALAVVALLAIGAYLLTTTKKVATTETIKTQTENTIDTQNTIKNLLASNSPQQCSYTDPEGASNGTVYVANGKMAGEFNVNSPQGAVTSHMFSDGTDMYIWMDGQPQGIMMSLSGAQEPNTSTTSATQNVDVNKPFDFDCVEWTVDETMFAKPTSVTFVNMNSLIPTGTGAGSGQTMPSCSACDILPAAAQASCKAAIPGCS